MLFAQSKFKKLYFQTIFFIQINTKLDMNSENNKTKIKTKNTEFNKSTNLMRNK